MINRALQRLQGLVWGDGTKDASVYLDGQTAFVDVVGRQAGQAAFKVRGLDPANNAPTDLFTVYKDGTTTGATGWVYPESLGAVADVKTVQGDGSIASGSAVLTTVSALFAPSDVGKLAVVVGAGAAGASLVTTVACYTNPSSVTLALAASTTSNATRWAVGSDSTAQVNAALAAAALMRRPVRLSGLYGTTGVLLQTGQVVIGDFLEWHGFYRMGAGLGAATVALAAGATGDGVRLSGFLVNNMFLSTYDGIEIGTGNAAWALASGGSIRDVKVRNAGGWGVNVLCNVAVLSNIWVQHDQTLPAGNTTAGGIRLTDTLVYTDALTVEASCPAGAFYLGAGGGSIYDGLQMELTGVYAAVDVITVAANQAVIKAVYATLGTHRDLIRILTTVREVSVEMIHLAGTYTLTNVVNDVDRAATIVSTGTDAAYLGYWTANVLTFAGQLGLLDLSAWTSFAPTWTGFSADPTVVSRYKQIGKTVVWTVNLTSAGTSNATGLTATLPVTARATQGGAAFGIGVDNGAAAGPVRMDLSSTTVATFYKDAAATLWTASGTKGVRFTVVYEAA